MLPSRMEDLMGKDKDFRYCAARHSDGWLCILGADHAEHDDSGVREHLSIDYTVLWRGTPGRPISWSAVVANAPTLQGRALGYSGEPCQQCGSPNTRRTGTCLTCDNCGFAGSCG